MALYSVPTLVRIWSEVSSVVIPASVELVLLKDTKVELLVEVPVVAAVS